MSDPSQDGRRLSTEQVDRRDLGGPNGPRWTRRYVRCNNGGFCVTQRADGKSHRGSRRIGHGRIERVISYRKVEGGSTISTAIADPGPMIWSSMKPGLLCQRSGKDGHRLGSR